MPSIRLSYYEAEEGDLPDACMRCGAPATERHRRRFVSHPAWVYLLLPFGLLPYFVVAAVLTRHVRCYTLFCRRHRHHWLARTLVIWGAFAAVGLFFLGGMALAASAQGRVDPATQGVLNGLVCAGTPVLVLCLLVAIPVIQATAIHPADATEDGLTLKRVSPAFVEAVRVYRENQEGEVRR